MRPGLTAPTLQDLEALAAAALDRLPEPFLSHSRGVVIRVADWPDEETLDALGIDNPYELTGLYEGVALTEKSEAEVAPLPDAIWLYRRPILDEWAERGEISLGRMVEHVLIHEIAHHFGWSDHDIAEIDDWRL